VTVFAVEVLCVLVGDVPKPLGCVFAGPIVLKQSGNQRGGALGRIWIRRSYGIVGIGIGYALEEDGLWREHSFSVLREGILETKGPNSSTLGSC
jgi:hypothetical protein